MANQIVAGEQYYDLDGQLAELKRQLRQPNGYPFDPEQLKRHLQVAIEGRFNSAAEIIIRVDRSVKPAYPDWMKELLHPGLELTGPAEYPLAKVELWLHEGQKNGGYVKKGQIIYDYLERNKMLDGCLGLADLVAIQKLGLETFRRYFKGKAIFAWKSVVRNAGGRLGAPCLCESGGKVVLGWDWLDYCWDADDPALRLAM